MNLPNKLTIGRVVAVPFFVAAYMLEFYLVALVIFVAASFTDMLDGKIARKHGLVTNFGKIMDPLADKILVYSAFCLMTAGGIVPGWMFIVILAREFAVSGMRTVAASEGIVVAAGMSGKIKTVFQMIAVPVLILALAVPEVKVIMIIGMVFLWIALVFTVISGVEYIVRNKEVFSMENKA